MSSYRELPSDQTVAGLSAEVFDLRRRNKTLRNAAVVFAVGFGVTGILLFAMCIDAAMWRPMGVAGLAATCVCLSAVSSFMYFGTVLMLRSLPSRSGGDDVGIPPAPGAPVHWCRWRGRVRDPRPLTVWMPRAL